ncbi:MAG: succinylglutamate desuccinylase/aspartoacylase family protein [Phyllobacteriaceae bacterium]|jgi:predicted deacylase|nr:succinylglutamate desuccinylase/aspartoacylase family protein [Phyllobacteriaceae bacterium]
MAANPPMDMSQITGTQGVGHGSGPGDLPISVKRHGDGPTVLLVGGTHGDEYEGQIVVAEIARCLDSLDMRGTLICLPRHNPGACLAGRRTDPEDANQDINRVYGMGSATGRAKVISDFVSGAILPHVDWVIDLHSGGASHEFVVSGNVQAAIGSDEDFAMRPYLQAFGAPFSLVFDGSDHSMPHAGTLEHHAKTFGARAISSELGGGGRVSLASIAAARDGVMRLLGAIGMVEASPPPPPPGPLVEMSGERHTVTCDIAGVIEPVAQLGDAVTKGQTVARLHPDNLSAPLNLTAQCTGIVACMAATGRSDAAVEGSDVIGYVCEPITKGWPTR